MTILQKFEKDKFLHKEGVMTMEKFRRTVCHWNLLLPSVKGNKSHQFTTDSLGVNIYFNSSGMPFYVADDTHYTDFENHMTEKWYHEYYYNKTEVSAATAINNFRNGIGSIYIGIVKIFNQQEVVVNGCEFWLWDPYRHWLYEGRSGFSIPELIRNKWYTITDAIS